jgi:hypothetical protein
MFSMGSNGTSAGTDAAAAAAHGEVKMSFICTCSVL